MEGGLVHRRQSFVAYAQSPRLMQPGDGAFDNPPGLAQVAAMRSPAPGKLVPDAALLQCQTNFPLIKEERSPPPSPTPSISTKRGAGLPMMLERSKAGPVRAPDVVAGSCRRFFCSFLPATCPLWFKPLKGGRRPKRYRAR